ncbi:MAG: HTTM domain-containing protein [Candidatus Omnitrophica bacterium]|nr:HTTM domain-containing protein [Candidatus Omnitrophota bacterium]
MKTIHEFLFRPAHPAALGLFRLLYGVILLVHLWDQWPHIAVNFIEPEFHFSYPGLSWIHPLPGAGMYVVHGLMAVLAVGILLGIRFRTCLGAFLCLYLYTFLIDAAYYKNHYYLTFLTGMLLWFTPANYCFVFRAPERTVPCFSWHVYLIRFQFCVVYFYAGLAKLNWDWWYGEPVRHLLRAGAAAGKGGVLSPLYGLDVFIYLMIYGGAMFDLLVPFFLINRATRKYAALVSIFFHSCNHLIFPNILIFPFLMMFSLVVFFNSDWPTRNRFLKYYCKVSTPESTDPTARQRCWVPILLGLYAAVQIALPLRHHLYPGDIFWTSQGEHFAWRMILKRERANLKMYIVDPRTGEKIKPEEGLINFRQFIVMKTRPRFILQFAHYLARRSGIPGAKVYAENWHSINGREYQLKISPETDLTQIRTSQSFLDWMAPFDKRLPAHIEDPDRAAAAK